MERTTDFQDFLDNVGIDSAEEMFCVYRSVLGESDYGYELVAINGGNYLLRCPESDIELFLTPRSRDAFIRYMDSLYDLGVEGQAAFEHAMQKDD